MMLLNGLFVVGGVAYLASVASLMGWIKNTDIPTLWHEERSFTYAANGITYFFVWMLSMAAVIIVS